MKKLNLNAINIGGGTQPRERIDLEVVADYAEAVKVGIEFPPVIVFHDGAENWLADGFHRWHAHNEAGKASIAADVRQGTLKDARLYAASREANGSHGLRRSNADKRLCVQMTLAASPDWSDNRIADHVGVDHKTVAAHRAAILGISQDAPAVRTVERAGKTYQQDTSRIGKGQAGTSVATPRTAPEREPSAASKSTPPKPAAAPAEDDAFDGFDPVAELEATQKLLEAADKRIEALTVDDVKAELNKQIGIRQGIEARLSLEMSKVGQMQKDLDSYGKWYAELRKLTGLEKRSDITKLVREAANNNSEAV